MIRHDELGAVADGQACRRDIHTSRGEHVHFGEKRLRVNDHAVADYGDSVFGKDTGRYQMQGEFTKIVNDRVAGIIAAGIADNHVRFFCN